MTGIQKLKDLFPQTEEYQQVYQEARVESALADCIYNARTARGWSQAELARRAGTTQSGIARFENPDYTGIKLNTLMRLLTALDLELSVAVDVQGLPTLLVTDRLPQPAKKLAARKTSAAKALPRKPATRKATAVAAAAPKTSRSAKPKPKAAKS